MSIELIRPALEAVLADIPGINSASGWPTEQANAVPMCIVGWDRCQLTMANVEQGFHNLPITVIVQRKGGNLKNQVIAIEALIEPIKAALRAKQDLGMSNLVNMVQYGEYREGVYLLGGVDYVGFILDVRVKETQEVSFKDAG